MRLLLEEQSDLGLHCLLRHVCPNIENFTVDARVYILHISTVPDKGVFGGYQEIFLLCKDLGQAPFSNNQKHIGLCYMTDLDFRIVLERKTYIKAKVQKTDSDIWWGKLQS